MIYCVDVHYSEILKIFGNISKNLDENGKHFKRVYLFANSVDQPEISLEDNLFADITFDEIDITSMNNIKKISGKAFEKIGKSVKTFSCPYCFIQNSPPKYDFWKALSSMNQLESLSFGLNNSEIPTNALGDKPNLKTIAIKGSNFIKSGAFINLNNLTSIYFTNMRDIKMIEKEAFKFSKKSNETLLLDFGGDYWYIKGDQFEERAFDGVQRPVKVQYAEAKIDYIPERTFKSLLNGKQNSIEFVWGSTVDCDNCGNLWLIDEEYKNQVLNAKCMYYKVNLFDPNIVSKLKKKCQKLNN